MSLMRIPCLIVLVVLLGCRSDAPSGSAPAAAKSAPRSAADPAAGHALVDRYVAGMHALAQSGSSAPYAALLAADDAEIRKLADQGLVGAEVRDRVLRLFDATRAFIAPAPDDAARRASQDVLDAFVVAVNGENNPPDPTGGMASYAPIFLEEALSLHMLLDGATDRDAARARYMKEP